MIRPKIECSYIGEELALWWTNPWSGKKEKIATFWWPGHPPEETKLVESWFESIGANASIPQTREGPAEAFCKTCGCHFEGGGWNGVACKCVPAECVVGVDQALGPDKTVAWCSEHKLRADLRCDACNEAQRITVKNVSKETK